MEEVDPENTDATPPGEIKGVDKETVHRICSGQVVLDLCTAVKELVENSLDAEANNLEIRLKENGTQLLQVIDNGHGVRDVDFQALTLKHATSKLTTFNDLSTIATFGFRGEALSSLCALGQVSISTRHVTSSIGTIIEFDHNGKITSQKNQARPVGTTVTITELFQSIPVRRREFVKNCRREFVKMCHILQAYCIIANGVRIVCYDTNSKGKRVQVMSSNGNSSMKENIVDIFGTKQVQSLQQISWDETKELTEEDLAHFNLFPKVNIKDLPKFKISGFVSSCIHGQGRNSYDRQFYFVNGRPCDPNKLSKVVNETYHQFNRHQNPFVCLNIETSRQEVDVNITPDKRQVLFENERYLVATVRAALMRIYEKTPATFEVAKSLHINFGDGDETEPQVESENATISLTNLRCKYKADGNSYHSADQTIAKRIKIDPSSSQTSFSRQTSLNNFIFKKKDDTSPSTKEDNSFKITFFSELSAKETKDCDSRENRFENVQKETRIAKENCENRSRNFYTSSKDRDIHPETFEEETQAKKIQNETVETEETIYVTDETESGTKCDRKVENLSFSMEKLSDQLNSKNTFQHSEEVYRRFLARISPTENQSAEEELRKEFSKEDFCKMEIFGQFNLGFIIAGRGDDLFIIDQHATDEKFNFERLQKSRDTEIHTQRLVIKQNLELTSVNEEIVMQNLETFRANGFDFQIHPDATPTQRVFLTQIPHSRQYVFGKQDIEELIFMLNGEDVRSAAVLRPSRVQSMFASRACRTSVMIGTALSKGQMQTLVTHMSKMENPWSCPHGRPTMRHLVNLNLIQPTSDGK